jgi:hypothetical protein
MKKKACSVVLLHALPMAVAMKKVQKGISRCPQVRPARSKRGFGIDAKSMIAKNPPF